MTASEPLAGLGGLGADFDLLLCDVYGTLHDAEGPFPAILNALRGFRAGGGVVVLVSNAATPSAAMAGRLGALGIGRETHDAVVSAADVARTLLGERAITRAAHLGLAEERVLFEGLDLDLVDIAHAEIIVCTGYPEPEGDLAAILAQGVARGLDLACTNPDTLVIAGARPTRFAGSVAKTYADLGGRVVATGKPAAAIYDHAIATAERIAARRFDPARVVALGDSLALDVAGALAAGFSAVLAIPRRRAIPRRDDAGSIFSLYRSSSGRAVGDPLADAKDTPCPIHQSG